MLDAVLESGFQMLDSVLESGLQMLYPKQSRSCAGTLSKSPEVPHFETALRLCA